MFTKRFTKDKYVHKDSHIQIAILIYLTITPPQSLFMLQCQLKYGSPFHSTNKLGILAL